MVCWCYFLQWAYSAQRPASANCKDRNLPYGILFGFCLQKWRSARRGGVVSTVMGGIGSAISTTATLPDKIVEAIEDVSFLESIPLWLVSLLGSLLITVLSFVLILTVYGRFFKIFIYTAIAPLPLASFAGEATSRTGQTFLKSYVGVCMEGAVIVLSCVIYSAFLSGGSTALDESLPAVTMVWQYIGQLMFNMLVLTGLVKGSNRLVHEMLGA